MNNEVIKRLTHIHHSIKRLNEDYIGFWKDDMFLTWRWWLIVALLVLPWFIWFLV